MAAATDVIVIPKPQDSTAAKTLRFAARAPVHVILVVLGLLWLVPTFGLFITSILPASTLASNGWWQIFSKPSLATWSNYNAMFHNHGLLTALKTTAYIAVGNTLLVVDDRSARGLRVRVARVPGPRLALPRRDRAARRSAADGADPDVPALRQDRALRHGARDHPLPCRLRPAVRDLPAAQLLRRAAEGHPRICAHRRRVGDSHLRAADPAARPARDRVALHLPVPLDVERPDRRPHVRPEHVSRSRSGSSGSCASSARAST